MCVEVVDFVFWWVRIVFGIGGFFVVNFYLEYVYVVFVMEIYNEFVERDDFKVFFFLLKKESDYKNM